MKWICLIVLSLAMINCLAQSSPVFKSLRYNEDYSHLKDSTTLSWYEQIKYKELNRSMPAFLSLGGEIRYQYFKFKNEDWGDAPPDDDGFILSRLLLNADLHFTERFRIFTQLQNSISSGSENPSPVDQNELDLHQLLVDFTILKHNQSTLMLRAGRQELSYGSSRLISVREGPNNRQAFDGLKLLLKRPNFTTDLFYSYYVVSEHGIFNDKGFDHSINFAGMYSVLKTIPVVQNIDLYYLMIQREQATWNDIQGHESRHSVGSRIWGKSSQWEYDIEGVYQFGQLENNQIRAWTLSFNTNYELGNSPIAPSIGLKTELISGDKMTNDGRIESFNPMFPRGAYFGYAALIGPSNLFDVHPSINFPLSKTFSIDADYDAFWRKSINDGIYGPNDAVIYAAGESDEKFIGHQIGFVLKFIPNQYVSISGDFTWFKPGPYIKSMGAGKEIIFAGITTTLRF